MIVDVPIIITIIINDSGRTKVASDFTIDIEEIHLLIHFKLLQHVKSKSFLSKKANIHVCVKTEEYVTSKI
jgi:hypothetical protein